MQNATIDLVRTLAAVNGLAIPEGRLERVLLQYQDFLRTLDELNGLPLPAEVEPAFVFSVESSSPHATVPSREK